MTEEPKKTSRESSKVMVALAQQVMRETNNVGAVPDMDWLIKSARSLAGSVLSQANPDD